MSNQDLSKSKRIALLLAVFLGFIGAHRFYVKKHMTGIIYILTGGVFTIGVFLDIFLILSGKFSPMISKGVSNEKSNSEYLSIEKELQNDIYRNETKNQNDNSASTPENKSINIKCILNYTSTNSCQSCGNKFTFFRQKIINPMLSGVYICEKCFNFNKNYYIKCIKCSNDNYLSSSGNLLYYNCRVCKNKSETKSDILDLKLYNHNPKFCQLCEKKIGFFTIKIDTLYSMGISVCSHCIESRSSPKLYLKCSCGNEADVTYDNSHDKVLVSCDRCKEKFLLSLSRDGEILASKYYSKTWDTIKKGAAVTGVVAGTIIVSTGSAIGSSQVKSNKNTKRSTNPKPSYREQQKERSRTSARVNNCVTCAHWGGDRKTDPPPPLAPQWIIKYDDMGYCVKKRVKKPPLAKCDKYSRWGMLS